MNFFQIGCSEQLNKIHNFRKIIFVTGKADSVGVAVRAGNFDLKFQFENYYSSCRCLLINVQHVLTKYSQH